MTKMRLVPSKVILILAKSDSERTRSLEKVIRKWFCKNDYDLLKDNLYDFIIEPRRAKLIPGFPEVKEAALNAGAHGMTISGSGPTVFSITNFLSFIDIIEGDKI